MQFRAVVIALFATFACHETTPVSTVKPVGTPTTAPTGDDAPLPLWSEVHKGKLANGLTYYVLEHHKPEKRAYMWLAVNAGSVQEDDDQRGLAHFDEHMAFNGTRRFPKQEILNYLQSIGMRFGADLNARTKFDDTVYELEIPTDDNQYVSKGLDILRDWAGEATYEKVEVDKERGVVLEEWRLNRGASMRLFDKQFGVMLKGTRYADRNPIGLPEVIKGAPRDALYRFYKDWYRPDLMAVIAVGDFKDPAAVEKEIEKKFADLKNPEHERVRPDGGVPPATGTRVSIETDKEVPTARVDVINFMPHRPESSKKDYRRLVVEQVYDAILNERLQTLARKPESPFVQAAGGTRSQVRDIDSFERIAAPKNGKVEESLRTLFTEVLRIERHGVTPSELERARTNIARALEELATTEATKDGRDFAEELTRNYFENELIIGSKREKELTLAMLPTITVDDLNRVAKNFGGADSRAIVISGPEGKPLPSRERVLAIVDEVTKSQIPPWTDAGASQPLVKAPPAPGKIVGEKTIKEIGVTEWTLGNGARVIVKPTDFETDNVMITARSPGGLAIAKDADYNNARFSDDIAAVSGVGELDSDTLGKVLAGKHAEVAASLDDTQEGVQAQGSAKDLETMFQLVYLRVAEPRKDSQQFEVWKQNTAEQLENQQRSPEFQFFVKAKGALFKNHPREEFPTPAQIKKVDLDKAFAFYKDRFADVSDFTFVIVGDVKLDRVKPLVETYIASLPGKGRKEKEKDNGVRKVGGVVKKQWAFGQEQKARVIIDFHGDEAWSRDKERDIKILDDVLTLYLNETLREEMGGVYGVNVGGQLIRATHQEREFQISFGCAPDRVDALIAATFDEIKKLATKGPDEAHLDQVKQQFLRSRETAMRTNEFWADWLTRAYRFGDDPTIILDPSGIVARMTPENVKAAAKHYLDSKQYFQAILLPADSAQAPEPGAKKPPEKKPPEKKPPEKVVPGAEKP
jgi:zinc protease